MPRSLPAIFFALIGAALLSACAPPRHGAPAQPMVRWSTDRALEVPTSRFSPLRHASTPAIPTLAQQAPLPPTGFRPVAALQTGLAVRQEFDRVYGGEVGLMGAPSPWFGIKLALGYHAFGVASDAEVLGGDGEMLMRSAVLSVRQAVGWTTWGSQSVWFYAGLGGGYGMVEADLNSRLTRVDEADDVVIYEAELGAAFYDMQLYTGVRFRTGNGNVGTGTQDLAEIDYDTIFFSIGYLW